MLSVQNEIVCDATLPSCTTVLILLAHNKQDQSYQNSCISFCLLHLFSRFLPDVRTRVCGIDQRIINTELEDILIWLLLFVKFIDEYTHHVGILGNQNWKNVRQHQTQSSTKLCYLADITLSLAHYRARYFPTQPLKMCSIILLKCKKLEATITFISFLILHWLIKLLSNVTFRMKL